MSDEQLRKSVRDGQLGFKDSQMFNQETQDMLGTEDTKKEINLEKKIEHERSDDQRTFGSKIKVHDE